MKVELLIEVSSLSLDWEFSITVKTTNNCYNVKFILSGVMLHNMRDSKVSPLTVALSKLKPQLNQALQEDIFSKEVIKEKLSELESKPLTEIIGNHLLYSDESIVTKEALEALVQRENDLIAAELSKEGISLSDIYLKKVSLVCSSCQLDIFTTIKEIKAIKEGKEIPIIKYSLKKDSIGYKFVIL